MERFRIGDREFLPESCELRRSGVSFHLQFQVRNVLLCLARHRGEVVDKSTLLREAWGGRHASEESLTRCISLLRREFDRGDGPGYIETIPKVGYRLRVEDECHPSNAHAPRECSPPPPLNETRPVLLPSADAKNHVWGRIYRSSVVTHALALFGGAMLAWGLLSWLHIP